MRGFLLTALAVFVAITIGVAIEPMTSVPPVPASVARAIAATMAVHSVEIRTSFPGADAPAVYQAPDRWEGSANTPRSTGGGQSGSTRSVIIGDWEYQTLVGSARHQGVLANLRPPPAHLSEPLGLPPAQDATFAALIDAREGRAFHRHDDTWTFRLRLTDAGAVLAGGSITLARGLVRSATIDEVEDGHRLVLPDRCRDLDAVAHLPVDLDDQRRLVRHEVGGVRHRPAPRVDVLAVAALERLGGEVGRHQEQQHGGGGGGERRHAGPVEPGEAPPDVRHRLVAPARPAHAGGVPGGPAADAGSLTGHDAAGHGSATVRAPPVPARRARWPPAEARFRPCRDGRAGTRRA